MNPLKFDPIRSEVVLSPVKRHLFNKGIRILDIPEECALVLVMACAHHVWNFELGCGTWSKIVL